MSDKKPSGLCHRCEYRARYMEEGHGPRCECSGPGAVHSCYMYLPVAPMLQMVAKHETGPRRKMVDAPAFIRPRMSGAGVADGHCAFRKVGRKFLCYWTPDVQEGKQ